MDKIVTRFGLMVILTLAVIICAAPVAQATIVGSPHDLGFLTHGGPIYATNETQICIFCHTPHGGLVSAGGVPVPLWNQDLAAGSYAVYGSATLNATLSNPPTGETLLCMSCHDGVSTLDTLINYSPQFPSAAAIIMAGSPEVDNLGDVWIGPGNPPDFPGDNIGERPYSATINLSNDHPVSFLFNAALITLDQGTNPTPRLQLPAAATGLKLFGTAPNTRLECATCHDAHEWGSLAAGTVPFLRMSNTGSQMCLACHIK